MTVIYLNDKEVARIGAEYNGIQADVYLRLAPIVERIEVPTEHALYGGERITAAERKCAELGHKIAAIKSIRERTNMGLKDAVRLLDSEVPNR